MEIENKTQSVDNVSHFTMLIILKVLEKTYHSVVRVTLADIRELYWIVQARQAVKRTNIYHSCDSLFVVV